MTPSEVAAELGLDLVDAVRAVPFPDTPTGAPAAPTVPREGTGRPERRIRRVVGG